MCSTWRFRNPRPQFAAAAWRCAVTVGLAAWLAAAWGGTSVWGQETSSESAIADDEPIVVLRQYVPYEDRTEFIKGFMPMTRAEFDERLKRIGEASERSQSVRPKLGRGVYFARFVDGQLTDGRARIDVRHTAGSAGVVSLERSRLPMRKLRWADEQAPPATAGMNAAGEFVVMADRSDTLLFAWSLGGTLTESNDWRFHIELPPCAVHQVVLDLPLGVEPVVQAGIVQLLEATDGPSDVVPPPLPSDSMYRRWLIELGGQERLDLEIVRPHSEAERRARPRLREAIEYRLTQAGLELRAAFTLDVTDEPLPRLELRIDPSLQVIGARVGGVALPLSRITRSDQADRVVLDFARPLELGVRVVVVEALAPISVRQQFSLPDVEPLDVLWEQGTIELRTDDSLELTRLIPRGCVQSIFRQAQPPETGEVRQFHVHDASGEVVVEVDRPQPSARVVGGNVVRLNDATMVARLTLDVTSRRGDLFVLEANVRAPWSIDSVVAIPADSVDVDPARIARTRRLRLRFPQAIRDDQRVRVVLTAHRLTPASRSRLRAADFRVLAFPESTDVQHVVALQAESSFHVRVSDAPGVFRSLDDLTPQQREVLEAPAGSSIFLDEHPSDAFSVALTRERPQYTAEATTEALVAGDVLRLTHRVRCEPASSPVASVLVQFGRRLEGPIIWSVDGDEQGVIAARAVDAMPASNVETWQVSLRDPRIEPFELLAAGTIDFQEAAAIGLVTAPEATSQSGILVVGTTDATPLAVDDSGLQPLPPKRLSASRYPLARSAYRYDSARDGEVRIAVLRNCVEMPAAWVWNCRVVSLFESKGGARHEATFNIQNLGLKQFAVVLPDGVALGKVTVGGVEMRPTKLLDGSQRLTLRLPPNERFPTVQVTYDSQADRLGFWGQAEAAWPQVDVPCLDRTWHVWLPPGYQAVDDGRRLTSTADQMPWEQRLFGVRVLRRSAEPFDLFSATDWESLWAAAATQDGREAANAFHASVASVLAEFSERAETQAGDAPPVTWSEVLSRYDELARAAPAADGLPRVLVDATALAEQGVQANTRVAWLAASDADAPIEEADASIDESDRADSVAEENAVADEDAPGFQLELAADSTAATSALKQLLTRHGLVVVASPDVVLLTSVARLAELSRRPRATDAGHVVLAAAGAAFDDPAFATAGELAAVPPARWRTQTMAETRPWGMVAPVLPRDDVAVGWRRFRLRIDEGTVAPLGVYRPDAVSVLAWSAFFAAAGLGMWLCKLRSWLLVWLATLVATLLLLAPIETVPLLRGLMFGLLAGFGCLVVRPRTPPPPADASDMSYSIRTSIRNAAALSLLGVTALLAALAGVDGQTAAQEPDEDRPVGQPRMFPVIIPVDEDRQPWGETLHVPDALWKVLQRRTESLAAAPLDWLLRSATYQTTVSQRGEAAGLYADQVVAFFEIETFRADVEVALPLGRQGVRFLSAASLNQEPISLDWDTAGTQLALRIARPGRHYLELAIQPQQQNDGATSGFDLIVPRLATSRLRISCPAGADRIRIPGAIGARQRDTAMGVVEADLGPQPRLSVRWPRATSDGLDQPELLVEQKLWLHVRPTSVSLAARFSFAVLSGSVQEVRLHVDPRLRLSQLDGARRRPADGNSSTIVAELPEPTNDEFTIDATFVVTDTSSVGNLFFPRVEAEAEIVGPTWMAVSIPNYLRAEAEPTGELQVVMPEEFVAQWGASDGPPRMAFRNLAGTTPWRLALEPVPVRPSVSQHLTYSIGRDQAAAEYEARILGDGARFQHRLRVPRAFHVQSVTCVHENLPRQLRWARAGDELTVFLNESVAGDSIVRMIGDVPVRRPQRLDLPVIGLVDEGGEAVPVQRVDLFRRSSVLIRDLQAPGLNPDETQPQGAFDTRWGRRWASFRPPATASDSPAPISMKVAANVPRIVGSLVQELEWTKSAWTVDAHVSLDVRAGLLDEFRLAVPDAWPASFELTPAWPWEISREGTSRVLVVRPPQPISGDVALRLRVTENRSPEQLAEAPIARLNEPTGVTHSLVLPNRRGDDEVAWDVRGLRPVDLSDASTSPAAGDAEEDRTTYLMIGRSVRAAVRNVTRVSGSPRVRLADTQIVWRGGDRYVGVVAFDVEPAQLRACRLAVPSSVEVIHLSVEGIPTPPRAVEPGRWQFDLSHHELPQRVEVLFQGELVGKPAEISEHFAAPTLLDLPVVRTLWTIRGPGNSVFHGALLRHGITTPQQLFEARAAAASEALTLGDRLMPPQPPRDNFAAWRSTWMQRRDVAQQAATEVQESGRESIEGDPDLAQAPDSPDAPSLAADATSAAMQLDLMELWRVLAAAHGGKSAYLAFRGQSDRLVVEFAAQASREHQRRFVAAASLIALAAIGMFLARLRWVRESLEQWPHVAGVTLGLMWWLWCTPSVLGLVIASVFALGAIRPAWRQKPLA